MRSYILHSQPDKADGRSAHAAHGGSASSGSLARDAAGDPGGAREAGVDPAAIEELSRAIQTHEVMPLLLSAFKLVDFEVRKTFTAVFCYATRHDIAGFASAYLPQHTALLYALVDGYTAPDLALHCGTMLRECIKLPDLHKALLYGPDGGLSKPLADILTTHVRNPNFEVAADAFETLAAVMTNNKALVYGFLNPDGDAASAAHYAELFALYGELIESQNYVLKRQSLKLLSEFLLDRDNFRIMMRYISDRCVVARRGLRC